MATYFSIHPDNPQPRLIRQVVEVIRGGGLIVYPTDSGYAFGCQMGNRSGLDRIRRARALEPRHHFTLMCHDFAQLGQFVTVSNSMFRLVKACTPGSYTFILTATKAVPPLLQHPRKRTVGVRFPQHAVAQALVAELGEPLLSSTLLLPGHEEPPADGSDAQELVDHLVDAVVDGGSCGTEPTTVVDLSESEPEIIRRGAGDTSRFE